MTTGFKVIGSRGMEPEADWLAELLAAEAASYTPDSRRLRASVHERAEGARRTRRRALVLPLRLAGIPAGIATAVLCATVAVAVTATVGSGAPRPGPGSNPAPAPDPTAPAVATQSPVMRAPVQASVHTTGSASSATSVVSATASVDRNSIAVWSQEDVWVTLAEPVASFQLTVKVSMSPQLASTGSWMTYNPDLFDVSVQSQSSGVVYKFELKSGATLPVGAAQFAVQFNHGAAHNSANDTYFLSAYTDKAHGDVSEVSQGTF